MDNMSIYEKVRKVPDSAKKAFNNGNFSGTDINPMWRIKVLTELFGACGTGWYTDVLSERAEAHDDGNTVAIVDLNLYYKTESGEWSKPVYGTGGNMLLRTTKDGKARVSDEGYKMAYTDALSVACKALGIGADVYYDKDTSSKYYKDYQQQHPAAPAAEPAAPAAAPRATVQQVRGGGITEQQKHYIETVCTDEEIKLLLGKYRVNSLNELNILHATAIVRNLEKRDTKEAAQ